MNTSYFARSFQYDAWANRRTLQALKNMPNVEERSRHVMAHLLAAQKVWFTRLRGEDTSKLVIWPQPTLEQCEPLLEENAQASQQYLASLSPERLQELLTYRTSTGIEFRTAIVDILTQVLLHGAYHRGQLAAAIKRQGGDPPMTDFIFFAREA